MLKYLCHVTARVNSTIDGDNLRGEPRWERNSFAALLAAGRDVHSTFPIWRSSSPKPFNFHDGINSSWQDDSILITYGMREHHHITARAKYYIVNYLDGPDKDHLNSFAQFSPSILAICNWNSWLYLDRLRNVLGSENVEWVQGPFVPNTVDDADNFDKSYLLWSFRNFWYFNEREPGNMAMLFNQVRGYLDDNPRLRLGIIIGWWRPEILRDPKKDGKAWVMSQSCFKDLSSYSERIDVFSILHWHEVLDLLSKTKLVISPSESLGCPAYEAAMYGIPTILDETSNPFQNPQGQRFFSDLLVAPRTIGQQFLESIDLLYRDHDVYRKYGDAYRTYVKNNATYKAFCNQIDKIVLKRGWQ